MNDTITDRQLAILRFLQRLQDASRIEIENEIKVSRITVIREINGLQAQNLVNVSGKGPSTKYSLADSAKRLKLYDPAVYLAEDLDSRSVRYSSFNIKLLEELATLCTEEELDFIAKSVHKYRAKLGSDVSKNELERFIIELSWKSSKIEGNTYSLLDTEQLIKGSIEAAGHSHEEAVMILNHKTAFDYIWQNKDKYKKLSRQDIEEIHRLLVKDLGINHGLRKSPVGITGTVYSPPASQVELVSHLDQLIDIVNHAKDPLVKAVVTLTGLSYLQLFTDGNKRTARLVSNALLLAHDYPPLSYRTVDEKDYKGSLILFYEQGAAGYVKDLFIQQLEFSANNYSL